VKKNIALAVFAAQFACVDFFLRRPPARVWIASACVSVAFWVLAASFAERRSARAAIAALASVVLVVELLFFRYYHVFLDDEALRAARHMWSDVRPVVMRLLPGVLGMIAVASSLEFFLLSMARRVGKRARVVCCAIACVSFFFLPSMRDAAPDIAAIGSLRALAKTPEARAASSVTIEPLASRRDRLPNVLFILDESVRASDYDDTTAPETAALTRGRVDLREMRAVASYTSICVSSLLTSRPPTETDAALDHAPYVFDFARAVRLLNQRVHVGYFSAQTDSLFERRDVRSAADAFVTVDDLVGHRVADLDDVIDLGVDRMLASRVERDLPHLEKPFFAMVHLSGTHAPYFVDDARAPFKPYRHTVTWSGLNELHAAYRDAIFEQDASVARVVRAFFAAAGADPALVVFTSDHGEAFGEHSAIHHGQSLYDEQIHVPAWVLSKNGALDAREASALAAHADDFVTHLDVVPTLLDAYGVLDAFGMREWAPRLAGRSLFRSERAPEIVPITNCTEMFPCPVRTWGVMSASHELVAQSWDASWQCVDLHTGSIVSDEPACAMLRDASRGFFSTLPNGRNNR
jgi:glucan phosphoethanolaminetransferase (alkaline phosphatase superfamily)